MRRYGYLCFYVHEQSACPLPAWQRVLVRLLSPRFAHVNIRHDGRLYDYSMAKGWRSGDARRAKTEPFLSIPVELDGCVLDLWRQRPRYRLPATVRHLLSLIGLYPNCASVSARAAGLSNQINSIRKSV